MSEDGVGLSCAPLLEAANTVERLKSGFLSVLLVMVLLPYAVSSSMADWVPDGTAICAAPYNQPYHVITSDGGGGAIVAWEGSRSRNHDIYGRRVWCNGTIADVPGNPGQHCRNALFQNYPNPFRGGSGTTIHYSVAKEGRVEVRILDVAGRLVNTIMDQLSWVTTMCSGEVRPLTAATWPAVFTSTRLRQASLPATRGCC